MIMKSITLSNSEIFPGRTHTDMLMEMCKILFADKNSLDCYLTIDGLRVGFVGGGETQEIHWTEICLFNLPKALATPNNQAADIATRVALHAQQYYYHPKHIIDYLYGEYREQALWNKNLKTKI